MRWLKDILADAKAIFLAPVTNVLCGAGILLVVVSFADYDKIKGLALHGQVHIGPVIAGLVLVLVGTVLFYITNVSRPKNVSIDYNKGVEIRRGGLTIRIMVGEVQSLTAATRTAAIVLPANTTFLDDCATDKRTAMGAFFLERFPERVASLPALFASVLLTHGCRPDDQGQFTPGTTILLPDDFAKPAKVIVTAATFRTSGVGMASNPCVVCSCVENIFKCTADQRVDAIYLPILGSGHGGVDRGMALLFLVLAVLHFARTYHHIRQVQIIVHPKDVDNLNQSKELSQIMAL